MAIIGSLSVKLGLVTIGWDKETDDAKRKAKELRDGLTNLTGSTTPLKNAFNAIGGAAGLTAIGFGTLLSQSLAFADEVDDVAKGFGLTTGKVLQFRDALVQSGGEATDATVILSKLFAKVEEARKDVPEAVKLFADLGISIKELKNATPNEMVGMFFDAIKKKGGDAIQKVADLREVLGKSAAGLDIGGMSEKLNSSTDAYEKYGSSIEKVAQLHDNLAVTMANLKIAFIDMIAPFTADGVISVNAFKIALFGLASAQVISTIIKFVELWKLIKTAIDAAAKAEITFLALQGPKGWATLAGAGAAMYAASKYLDDDQQNESEQGSKKETALDRSNASFNAYQQRSQLQAENFTRVKNGLPRYGSYEELAKEKGWDQKTVIPQAQNKTTEPSITDDAISKRAALDKARLDLAKQLASISEKQSQLEIDAFTQSEKTIGLKKAQLDYDRSIAQAASERDLAIASAEKDEAGIKAANDMYAIKEGEANKKLIADKKLITLEIAQQSKILRLNYNLNKDIANSQSAIIHYQLEQLTTDKYSYEQKQALLELEKQRVQINDELAISLAKQGINPEEADNARLNAKLKINAAEDDYAVKVALSKQSRTEELRKLNEQIKAQKNLNSIADMQLTLDESSYLLSANDLAIAQEKINQLRIIEELNNRIVEIQSDKTLDDETAAKQMTLATDQANADMQASEVRQRIHEQDEARRTSFSEGWSDALRRYREEATNSFKLAGQVMDSVAGNMTDAIMNFAETGKFSFKDLATSIIKDIMRIFLRWQIINLMSMAMGGGPVPFAGFVGSPAAKASGGGVEGDKPYMVGENGPELFVPKRSGTIVPHARLSDAMNQQPQTVINGPYIASMNAIDTQSGIQFLAKNKQAVWAAHQSAQRGIPASR